MVMTMFEPVRISPSILSADFMDLASDIATIQRGGADWVHVDVMDGHFVPNLTMGVPLVRQLKRSCTMPLDVHLMISNPLRQIPWFVEAGADIVTFHIEAVSGDEGLQAVELARSLGAQVGVAVKPATPVGAVAHLVPLVDMVLVMSVEPGFSGQSYIEGSELKVTEVVDVAREAGCAFFDGAGMLVGQAVVTVGILRDITEEAALDIPEDELFAVMAQAAGFNP